LTPYSRHPAATVVLLIFNRSASNRLLQCVTPRFLGGGGDV
jgi:hypothetical protein